MSLPRVAQLRIYTIKRGKMDEWIAGWRDGVYPLRLRHGFEVPFAGRVDGEDRFVWILAYEGTGSFEAKDRAYYESDDRKNLRPDPADLIAKQETFLLTPVL